MTSPVTWDPPAVLARIPCVVCGRTPAATVRFYGQHKIPEAPTDRVVDGAFCRDCGLATFRTATEWTLAYGWRGVSSFLMSPVSALMNLGARRQVMKSGVPSTSAASPPLPPGPPLWKRWRIVGALVPLSALVVVAGAVIAGFQLAGKPPLGVGSCVEISGMQGVNAGQFQFSIGQARVVTCGGPHNGKVTSEVTNSSDCRADQVQLTDKQANTYCVTAESG